MVLDSPVEESAVRLDAAGNPIVAYHDITSNFDNVKVAHCSDANCSTSTTTTLIDYPQAGTSVSLALNPSGNPVVSYFNGSLEAGTGTLRVAVCSDPDCVSTTITQPDNGPALTGLDTSTVVDAAGHPVVSYRDNGSNGSLKLLHCGNETCTSGNSIAVIETANFAMGTSLALDSAGNPVVAYVMISGGLHIAHCSDANCTGTVSIANLPTFGATSIGGATTLALDAQGFPVLAYPRQATGVAQLRLLHCGDANCGSGNVGAVVAKNATQFESMKLDASGNPVISYLPNGVSAVLAVIHCGNGTCSTGNTAVKADRQTGGAYNSLVLDTAGNPVISYERTQASRLTLLHCGTTTCK
jgi:hypothetical protein